MGSTALDVSIWEKSIGRKGKENTTRRAIGLREEEGVLTGCHKNLGKNTYIKKPLHRVSKRHGARRASLKEGSKKVVSKRDGPRYAQQMPSV